MNIKVPDLNASALVNGFKDPGVLLGLADMIFMIVTKLLNLDISVSEYLAVTVPAIAVITGTSVKDVAALIASKNNATSSTNTGTKTGGNT